MASSFTWSGGSSQESQNGVIHQAFSTPPRKMQQEGKNELCKGAEEVAHVSTNTACTFNDGDKTGDKSKRAFAVRWTSSFPAININTAEQGGNNSQKTTLSKSEELGKEGASKNLTLSPFTAINVTSPIGIDNDAREGGSLSLENLLRETQQQLTELLWFRRLCRAQQAALDAADERQETLEKSLLDARATLKEMKEHHRVYVAATAGELRQARESLVKKENALRVMKEEIDRLNVENERLCRLNRRAEADRTQWGRRQDCMEGELTLLLEKNSTLELEVKKLHTVFEELENLKHIVRQGWEAFCAIPNERITVGKDQSRLCVTDKNITGEKEEEKEENGSSNDDVGCGTAEDGRCVLMAESQEELCEQQVEKNTTDESGKRLKEEFCEAMNIALKRLFVLGHGVAELTAKFLSNEKKLYPTECQHEEKNNEESQEKVTQDFGAIVATFTDSLDSLEVQWGKLEETVMLRHHEAEEQQQRLKDEIEKMTNSHVEELQTWQKAARESTELLRCAELRCGKLLLAVEKQGRIAAAAMRLDVQDKKLAKSPHDENRREELKVEIERERDVEYDARSESELLRKFLREEDGDCEKTAAAEQQEQRLDRCALLPAATRFDSSSDRSVQLLVQRAHLATRKLVGRLREAHSQHEALVAKTHKERERHQAVVRRLQASLKAAQDAEGALRTQLATLTHSAATERSALARRAETAERNVGVKEKEERQRLRQLRETQQELEDARNEVLLRENVIVTLKKELAAQTNVSRESHFDVSTLKNRCDDLFHMMDALESQVQREVRHQNVLYETVRLLCTAVAALVLRVRGVAAERDALSRAHEAEWSQSCAAFQLLREFIKKEDEENKKANKLLAESESSDKLVCLPRCCYKRCSLYKFALLVFACRRMKQLVRRHREKRHVVFVINNDNNAVENIHGYNKNNTHNNSGNFNFVWHRAAQNSLQCLINSIPLVSTLFAQNRNAALMPKIELPPLQKLVDFIGFESIDDSKKCSKDVLQELMAVALLDMGAELTQFHGLADILSTRPLRHFASSAAQRHTHSSSAFVEMLSVFLGFMRQRLHTMREKLCQQDTSIQCLKKENSRLSTLLKEREQSSAELAQNLRDYEYSVAETCVSRDVYKELQQRLTAAHNALQEERKARRLTEEANVNLLTREVDLTRRIEEMRGELRFLSIELAEQQQQQGQGHEQEKEEQQSYCRRYYGCDNNNNSCGNNQFSLLSNYAATTYSSTAFQNGARTNSSKQSDMHLYSHRSSGLTVGSSPSCSLSPSANTVNANTAGDINCREDYGGC